jgi:hypothetical protein
VKPDIEAFAEKFIEGYLFRDLDIMAPIRAEPDGYGALHFPMLQACLAGVELLGGLLSLKRFDSREGAEYFKNYWIEYLAKVDPCYDPSHLDPADVYQLARNGLAHQFLTKPGLDVNKDSERKRHLQLETKDGEWTLHISCLLLASDLQDSYTRLVRPIVHREVSPVPGQPSRDTMNARLIDMLSRYEREVPTTISGVYQPHYQTAPKSVGS